MPKYFNRRVIQAVSEVTEGTDPGSGYTAILAGVGAVLAPSSVNTPRRVVQPSFSKKKPSKSQRQWTLPLELELAGGGISGTLQVPPIDPILKAAGMRRTAGLVLTIDNASGTFTAGEQVTNTTQASENTGKVVAATSTQLVLYDVENDPTNNDALVGGSSGATCDVDTTVTEAYVYQPWTIRDDLESATVHAYLDGVRGILTYGRATAQFNFTNGEKPMGIFNMQGVYNAPTATSNPSVTYSTVEAPECFPATIKVGSTTLTDVAIENVSFDLGNQIAVRPDLQASSGMVGVEIVDRTGGNVTLDPELASTLANLNAWDLWENQTENEISIQVGSTLGNRVWAYSTNAVIDEVSITDRNSLAAFGLNAGLYEQDNVDDAEFFLVFS